MNKNEVDNITVLGFLWLEKLIKSSSTFCLMCAYYLIRNMTKAVAIQEKIFSYVYKILIPNEVEQHLLRSGICKTSSPSVASWNSYF